jgi:hypothetical protein
MMRPEFARVEIWRGLDRVDSLPARQLAH